MIYRRHLIDHYDWLAGSEYLDEFLDESIVAIAMTAHGHGDTMVRLGAAWMFADGIVWKYGLEPFVECMREEDTFAAPGKEDLG